jgi:MoaA/NifB/PqqE/SkfB family radical SAM enzyme
MWSMDTIEWLDIELTSFCNIQCKGCFRVLSNEADKILNKEYLNISIIKEKFKKEQFPNIKIINFCGSVDEPTTHPQFFDIIRYFSEWNAHINIATNGSLRTEKWWATLASILPEDHRVTWGIDGSNSVSEIYREGSKFKKVQTNFRAFNKAGGKSNWQFIVFEHNEHQLNEAKLIAKQEGFVDFKTIISHRTDTNTVKPKQEKINNIPEETMISCKYENQKRIFINHMGNVIPCCYLNSKMLEYSVNNKKKDKFEELLETYDYKNTINLHNTSVEQSINSKIWNNIIASWGTDTPVPRCNQVCKKLKRDVFIKEKL